MSITAECPPLEGGVGGERGRTITAAGIRTNYHDEGAGAPVVLLHGSGPGVTAYANWRLTIPALRARHRVIAPDLIGFGETERPAGIVYRLETWVRHALGLLDALALPRVDLVGNSFGGALALALALRHPERVRRLVLMGSAGLSFPITAGLEAVWGYEPSVEAMRRLLDVFAFDQSLVGDDLARVRHAASLRPGYQEAFSAMFPAPRQRWVDGLASDERDLARLPHPTLIVHGREDRVIPPSCSQRLLELIPDAQLHVFGRCGHWTQIEHAGRFSRLVLDFLGEEPR
jgi:2-hydroxymuconate-semialdehyde hydrolase